jgi:transposase
MGMKIAQSTSNDWFRMVLNHLHGLYEAHKRITLATSYLGADETPVKVLDEDKKGTTHRGFYWVYYNSEQKLVLFDYRPGRGREGPDDILKDFQGYLQTAGYSAYEDFDRRPCITLLHCMAHARRKFMEAVKAQGRNKKRGKAHRGLTLIQKLYRIEKQTRQLSPEDRHQQRQQQAQPILDEIRTWLDQVLPQVPPTSATGKALHYLHNEWSKLIRYTDNGRLAIDNNAAENAIRPFVLGRKNWLFSDSVRGVKASANLYSLIETAKANRLEPYAYLRYLFTELPKAQTVAQIETLLPGNIDRDQIKIA